MAEAGYDGWADWYEEYLRHDGYRVAAETLGDLLGPGDGVGLDYGCGVGHQLPMTDSLARVLRPGGRCTTVAVHPCFAGATARWKEEGGVVVAPGYGPTEPRFVGSGVRARVGVRHVALRELLSKLPGAGFHIDRVEETRPLPTPMWLGIAAHRTRA